MRIRELTALEQRLYKFLDDIDSITEGELSASRWERVRQMMNKCKEDCCVQFGVVCNGYSTHIELPFDTDKWMQEHKGMASPLMQRNANADCCCEGKQHNK